VAIFIIFFGLSMEIAHSMRTYKLPKITSPAVFTL
jgi:hypothetical protein